MEHVRTNALTPLKTPRGVRTRAHRVRTLRNTRLLKQSSRRSHECERGTQKCVRYGRLHHLIGGPAGPWELLYSSKVCTSGCATITAWRSIFRTEANSVW